ncbi:hypothetical protein G7046_g7475 [Stylonectria norvegica]|nr:hypothetical protein G7046_g7475 [Stylonectria norvegica]
MLRVKTPLGATWRATWNWLPSKPAHGGSRMEPGSVSSKSTGIHLRRVDLESRDILQPASRETHLYILHSYVCTFGIAGQGWLRNTSTATRPHFLIGILEACYCTNISVSSRRSSAGIISISINISLARSRSLRRRQRRFLLSRASNISFFYPRMHPSRKKRSPASLVGSRPGAASPVASTAATRSTQPSNKPRGGWQAGRLGFFSTPRYSATKPMIGRHNCLACNEWAVLALQVEEHGGRTPGHRFVAVAAAMICALVTPSSPMETDSLTRNIHCCERLWNSNPNSPTKTDKTEDGVCMLRTNLANKSSPTQRPLSLAVHAHTNRQLTNTNNSGNASAGHRTRASSALQELCTGNRDWSRESHVDNALGGRGVEHQTDISRSCGPIFQPFSSLLPPLKKISSRERPSRYAAAANAPPLDHDIDSTITTFDPLRHGHLQEATSPLRLHTSKFHQPLESQVVFTRSWTSGSKGCRGGQMTSLQITSPSQIRPRWHQDTPDTQPVPRGRRAGPPAAATVPDHHDQPPTFRRTVLLFTVYSPEASCIRQAGSVSATTLPGRLESGHGVSQLKPILQLGRAVRALGMTPAGRVQASLMASQPRPSHAGSEPESGPAPPPTDGPQMTDSKRVEVRCSQSQAAA